MKFIIGIDEAGRAPLAGPVAVGAAMVRPGFDWALLRNVRDSKKMTAKRRDDFFRLMRRLQKEGELRFSVAYASHTLIDEMGITRAVRVAIAQVLKKLDADPRESSVFLDGLLAAPAEYKRQHTIIGGDDVLPLISMAAIAAKVSRDRLMARASKRFPQYGFESHKGYGTKAHWKALEEHGMCGIHRRTYCKSLSQEP